MRQILVRFAMLGLLAGSATSSYASATPNAFPAPKGLSPCPPGDQVTLVVSSVAAKLGGESLGCFLSDKKLTAAGSNKTNQVPVENAFAISLPGQAYSTTDLDRLLLHVRDQWNDFNPLNGKIKDEYISRLNKIIAKEKSSLPKN